MREAHFIIVPANHHHKSVVSHSFEKDYSLVVETKTTEIYPIGICFHNWQYSKIIKISNGVNTHVSQEDFAKLKNPLWLKERK